MTIPHLLSQLPLVGHIYQNFQFSPIFSDRSGKFQFTVLWTPPRYPQLYTYLFSIIVVSVLCIGRLLLGVRHRRKSHECNHPAWVLRVGQFSSGSHFYCSSLHKSATFRGITIIDKSSRKSYDAMCRQVQEIIIREHSLLCWLTVIFTGDWRPHSVSWLVQEITLCILILSCSTHNRKDQHGMFFAIMSKDTALKWWLVWCWSHFIIVSNIWCHLLRSKFLHCCDYIIFQYGSDLLSSDVCLNLTCYLYSSLVPGHIQLIYHSDSSRKYLVHPLNWRYFSGMYIV